MYALKMYNGNKKIENQKSGYLDCVFFPSYL